MLGWAFWLIRLAVSHLCSHKQPLPHLPVGNSNEILIEIVFICQQCPIWGDRSVCSNLHRKSYTTGNILTQFPHELCVCVAGNQIQDLADARQGLCNCATSPVPHTLMACYWSSVPKTSKQFLWYTPSFPTWSRNSTAKIKSASDNSKNKQTKDNPHT